MFDVFTKLLRRRHSPRTDAAEPGIADLRRLTPSEFARLLSGDQAEAARWVRAAAVQGSPAAQLRLGRLLLEGTGVRKDADAALRWFMTAARDNDVEAMNMVGRCHENGWGVAVDMQAAATWYRRAAERGDAWAQYNLGHLLLDGNGIARDHAAAFAWYSRAAAQGHPRALNLVARCLEHGWGTERDSTAAARAYRQSAEAGYFRGQYNHATILLAAGRRADALKWFGRAAANGPPALRVRIAEMLSTLEAAPAGRSADPCSPGDIVVAIRV
jgi:TPR repeat protein